MALMVRIGCFVPADEGSRVDLFDDVVALIGDHQTVHDDQSSFSSHVAGLVGMVERAGPGSLFLIDEIASGTDPQQGAALAQAILESFLDTGARTVVTTHFQRLKSVGLRDPRFAIAGMEFAQGRPTYRLVSGATGESHALDVAVRFGLDAAIVARAADHMDEGERSLAETLAALDQARSEAAHASRRAASLAAELEAQQASLAAREADLQRRARAIEQERAADFVDRLEAAEKAVSAVVADLQRAPSHKKVDAARASLAALRGLAPSEDAVAPRDEPLAIGDRVRLQVGGDGVVEGIGSKVTVRTSRGMTVRVKKADLTRLGGPIAAKRAARRPRAPVPKAAPLDLDAAIRYEANTVDLRGLRVDEGLDRIEHFLDRAVMDDLPVVFILHGHGTGAMKSAVRRWLPSAPHVRRWVPANPDQGGDAYTVAAVRA